MHVMCGPNKLLKIRFKTANCSRQFTSWLECCRFWSKYFRVQKQSNPIFEESFLLFCCSISYHGRICRFLVLHFRCRLSLKINLICYHVPVSLVNVSCSAFNGCSWWMVLANINVNFGANAAFIFYNMSWMLRMFSSIGR